MSVELQWEDIGTSNQRAKVFGGWIVKTSEEVITLINDDIMDSGYEWRISTCFVPDPTYEWEGD